MEKITLISRIILGLVFFIFGLNGFFHFIPIPKAPEEASQFILAIIKTGYLMPLIKMVEIIAGFGFLTGLFIPLSLVLITPILINIFLFNLVLNPSSFWMNIVITIPYFILLIRNYKQLSPLLKI